MKLWRLINPFVSMIARSPLHFIISHQILVVQFQGKKSRKKYLVPLSYHKHASSYTCVTLRSNIWWKNLKNLPIGNIWLKGKLVDEGVDEKEALKLMAIASQEQLQQITPFDNGDVD